MCSADLSGLALKLVSCYSALLRTRNFHNTGMSNCFDGFSLSIYKKTLSYLRILVMCSGLSLRFQVAGYLLLVAGEVTSSHGAPPPPQGVFEVRLKCNF